MTSLRIIVATRIAGTPAQAGNTWAMLQYLLGLRRLGHDVWLIDVIDDKAITPAGSELSQSANASYFREFTSEYGFMQSSALLRTGPDAPIVGATYSELRDLLKSADILLNISGVLRDDVLVAAAPKRVYLDIDPAFTQLWQHAEGIDMGLSGHTDFVTVGANIGQEDCTVPTLGLPWQFTLQPVVLEHWRQTPGDAAGPLTTIANWRGYGSITHDGVFHGQKVHSLRELIELPRLSGERFQLALAIDPAEVNDLALLSANRWELVDPVSVCGTPAGYQSFIRGSKAEFGVAKSGYVVSRSGWFSDRSACYLASGRPVIAQDTGFGRVLPAGRGLFAFQTSADVLDAIATLNEDYEAHAVSARGLAEEYFDSDLVLSRLLSQLGA
jgi:hypothetical protein